MLRKLMVLASAAAVGMSLCACSSADDPPDSVPTAFPPRPLAIDVGKVNPCSMLTGEQRSSLDIISARSRVSNVEGLPSRACGFLSGGSGLDYNMQIIPADAAVARQLPNAQITQVNGFGAVQNISSESLGPTPMCQVAIDVADGQTIRVQAFTEPGKPLLGDTELCRRTTEAASMVMTTVVATASR